jgi:hypothetical protein
MSRKDKGREPTRVREHGTEVTNPAQDADPGQARIDAVRRIVEGGSYAKVDGIMVDLVSASCIITVYDHLGDANKERYRNFNVGVMAKMAYKVAPRVGAWIETLKP